MDVTNRQCTRCKEFKSVELFYKQAERLESLCKSCKKEVRKERQSHSLKEEAPREAEIAQVPSEIQVSQKEKPKSYEDLGLTKNEFLEVVEFFKELMRLDQKGR